jgi:hypothetical protein
MNFQSELAIIITLLVVLIINGLFGNIISIFIFSNKEFRKQPPAFYLNVKSFVNIIALLYLPFTTLPIIWPINDLACKFFFGIMLAGSEYQSFMVSICSIDRLITVFAPFKYLSKNKMKFQIPLVVILSIVITGFVIPAVYFYDKETTSDNQTLCAFSNDPKLIWAFDYLKIQFILFRTIIPFILMIVSSSLIYWKIKSNKRKVGTLNAIQKKAYQLGITLIVMDILFCLFRLPTLINTVINPNGSDKVVYSFFYSMFVLFAAVHNAFNFLIFLKFNKAYRKLFFIHTKKLKSFIIKNRVSSV